MMALPSGTRRWLRVRGRSMWPLLWSGDEVRLVRGAGLSPGDAAVLLAADGSLVTHLVASTSPLETRSFLGTVDAPGLTALGPVDRVRRGGVELPWSRGVAWGAHGAALAAQRSAWATTAWHTGEALLSSPRTAPLRAKVLAPSVRSLERDEVAVLAVALSHFERVPAERFDALLSSGRVVVAEARGQVAGLLARDADGTLCHGHLSPWAQGLGLEARLVDALVVPGPAKAVVSAEQPGLVAALEARGFGVTAREVRMVHLARGGGL